MQLEHGLFFIIIGSVAAFFMAFNNGANDVANAFASAVGSKALKMKLAVAIASIVTFCGALLLGGHVAAKLVSGLVPPEKFNDPNQYVIAMIAVLIASGIFVLISTLTALPVSSSQAIVGSLTGIGIILSGWGAVPIGQLGVIVIGWIVSPLMAGMLAIIMCRIIENYIIGSNIGVIGRVRKILPVVVSIILSAGIYSLFTLTELKHSIGIDAEDTFAVKLQPNERLNRENALLEKIQGDIKDLSSLIVHMRGHLRQHPPKSEVTDNADRFYTINRALESSMSQLQVLYTGRLPSILYAQRWHVAIVSIILLLPFYIMFKRLIHRWTKHSTDDPHGAQRAFKNLQIGTSCYVAFAIGSNDVANSISPILAIYLVVKAGGIPSTFSDSMPVWILIIGGLGMATGITILGNRVMKTLGESLTKINNSRGFCIDFSVATSVVTASACGIPVSTTHAATGAVVGSGLSQGGGNVKFKVLYKIFSGWLVTIPLSALITAAIFEILKKIL